MSDIPVLGKTVQRRKEHRPQELIEAGLQEFVLNGFAATRMIDIAKRAGVAKGTIYVYFESKEALFEAAVRSQILPHVDQISGMVSSYQGTTKDLIKFIVQMMYDRVNRGNAAVLIRVMIAEGPKFPNLVQFYYQNIVSRGLQVLDSIVERGIQRGEIRQNSISKDPRLLIAPIMFAAVWKTLFDEENPIDIEQYCQTHIDVLLHGILTCE